jgi:hypothetical protein
MSGILNGGRAGVPLFELVGFGAGRRLGESVVASCGKWRSKSSSS